MDSPSNFRQSGGKRKGGRSKGGAKPQLFQDTSVQQPGPGQQPYGYGPPQTGFMDTGSQNYNSQGPGPQQWNQQQPGQYPGQQFLNDPMANMAMQYGTSLAGQGKDIVNKNLEKYVSTSKLKYYFAVDTAYVGKKLMMLFFPYSHTDWSIKYDQDQPVAPRYEINAPDLYIPGKPSHVYQRVRGAKYFYLSAFLVMAFVTYVLVSGIVLGTQNRFTPEQLGMQASTALVWTIIELVAVLLSLYIMNLSTELKYMDILAYIGYKYVGMIFEMLGGMIFEGTGYYCILLWFSISIAFFLVRTLRVQILPRSENDGFGGSGTKRSLYLILSFSLSQPILMWWLTRHIVTQLFKQGATCNEDRLLLVVFIIAVMFVQSDITCYL